MNATARTYDAAYPAALEPNRDVGPRLRKHPCGLLRARGGHA